MKMFFKPIILSMTVIASLFFLSSSVLAKDKVIFICEVSWFRHQGFYHDFKEKEKYKGQTAAIWRSGDGEGNRVSLAIGRAWSSRSLKIKNVQATKLAAMSKGITGGHESHLTLDLSTRSGAYTDAVESWTRFIGEGNTAITKIYLTSCRLPGDE